MLNKDEQLKLASKIMSSLEKESKNKIIQKSCLICDEPISSSCRSHNIPRMILSNLINGKSPKIYGVDTVFGTNNNILLNFNKATGIKNTQIFRSICRTCDAEVFSSIENHKSFLEPYTNKQLNLIALKQYLFELYRKLFRKTFNELGSIKINDLPSNFDLNHDYLKYDIDSLTSHNIEPIIKSEYNQPMIILFDEILNYKVNFSLNHFIFTRFDMQGNIIFDNMNFENFKKDLGYINVGVYPLEDDKTRVILFCEKSYEYLFNFIKLDLLNKQNLNQKLKYISDLIVMYNDKYVFTRDSMENLLHFEEVLSIDYINIIRKQDYLYFKNKLKYINLFNI